MTPRAFAVALVLALLSLAQPPVEASPKYSATLTSSDGGSTNTADLGGANQTALLTCDGPICFRTGTSTPITANCAQDPLCEIVGTGINSTTPLLACSVQMAGDRYLAARALDGGNPNCRLAKVYFNPSNR